MTVTWVVGAGGLLGRHVVNALERRGTRVLTSTIPWEDHEAAQEALREGAETLHAEAAGGPWSVAWCAGAGIVATPREELEAEVAVFRRFLEDLRALGPGGHLFLASSAGGVYSGSPDQPPYSEGSRTFALAPYGEAKLAMEAAATAFAESSGTRLLVGRISNLYGPGQNLAKPQGLVSLLCNAQLSGQPLSLFVSMDTLRDYLYVEDAAEMVAGGLTLLATSDEQIITKVIASGRATSIAALVGEATRVFRRRPPLVFRASAVTAVQVRDLRLASVVWPELDRLARTPLGVGLAATGRSIAQTLARPRIASPS